MRQLVRILVCFCIYRFALALALALALAIVHPHPTPHSSLVLPRHFVDVPIATKSIQPSCIANNGLKAIDPPHVLVVEDTEMCAVVVRILLGKLGCSSDHAENGAIAVEMLKKARRLDASIVC